MKYLKVKELNHTYAQLKCMDKQKIIGYYFDTSLPGEFEFYMQFSRDDLIEKIYDKLK